MPRPVLVLVHGAAVTHAVWDEVVPFLGDADVRTPERPRSGDLDTETAWLAEHARGAFVVGMSGGATLGLALAATEVPVVGALLHEPAAGRFAPGLLSAVAAAWQTGGVTGFGNRLYGSLWHREMAVDSDESLGHELAMFRSFEPATPTADPASVTLTVGERSPRERWDAGAALCAAYGYASATVPGAAHFAALEASAAFAELVLARAVEAYARTGRVGRS